MVINYMYYILTSPDYNDVFKIKYIKSLKTKISSFVSVETISFILISVIDLDSSLDSSLDSLINGIEGTACTSKDSKTFFFVSSLSSTDTLVLDNDETL